MDLNLIMSIFMEHSLEVVLDSFLSFYFFGVQEYINQRFRWKMYFDALLSIWSAGVYELVQVT